MQGQSLNPLRYLKTYNQTKKTELERLGDRLDAIDLFFGWIKSGEQSWVISVERLSLQPAFDWKGTFGIVPAELDGMFVSDKFSTYELNSRVVVDGWLRRYVRYPPLRKEARKMSSGKMSSGSAALSKLSLNPPKFLLLTVPLPTIASSSG